MEKETTSWTTPLHETTSFRINKGIKLQIKIIQTNRDG